jgi:hypothetical protein
MEQGKITYYAQCHRCKKGVELQAPLKTSGFLCNDCWLKWKEQEEKLIKKGSYQDEVNAKFISFVNDLAFLKKHNFGS